MRKSVKKVTVGMLAASMIVSAPATALAGQADGMDGVSLAAVTYGAKKADSKKPNADAQKPKAQCQKVGKVTCTASGKVNVAFKNKVVYTEGLKAVIKSAGGQEITCKIVKKNKSLLTVAASGLVKGQTYTITIEGIVGKDTNEPVTITKEFTAKGMKTQAKVGKTDVKSRKFVILKMKSATYYKNATVVVTDSEGNDCDAKIVSKSKGNIKVRISGMKKGCAYTITVNGVKTQKEKNYSSITRTVTVK